MLIKVLFLLLTNRQVRGKENIPAHGGLIVVANHVHNADPPILAVSLNRKAIFMAKGELFRSKVSGYFMRGFGAFPVWRARLDRAAMRTADDVIKRGLVLVVFPEGGRSKNAQLQSPLPGTAMIASRNGVHIIAAGITGTEKIKGFGWLFRRPRVTVTFGKPFSLPPVSGRLHRAELAQRADTIMMHIAELLPREYQGIYAR